MPAISLDLVIRGWDDSGWAGSFYPQDLPREWRLAFFANEFPSVLVPAHRWIRADASRLADWTRDTPEPFRFYLELPAQGGDSGLLAAPRRALGQRLAGVLSASRGRERGPGLEVPWFVPCARASELPAGCAPAVMPDAPASRSPRAGRAWLEGLARRFGDGPVLVLLEGEAARADILRHWWQLAWLMGLA